MSSRNADASVDIFSFFFFLLSSQCDVAEDRSAATDISLVMLFTLCSCWGLKDGGERGSSAQRHWVRQMPLHFRLNRPLGECMV
jgi:hypothetical protein